MPKCEGPEILACVLRPGNAGANNAEDHIRVFHTAAAQLPESFYDGTGALAGGKVLVRTDSAGTSRKFLWHLHSLGVQFSTSYTLPFGKAHMIDWINDKEYWQPALDQNGTERTDAWVINATDVIPLTDYPHCSCAPSRSTQEPSQPFSMSTGTGSLHC